MNKKRILGFSVLFSVVLSSFAYWGYQVIYEENILVYKDSKPMMVYIYPGDDWDVLKDRLSKNKIVHDMISFGFVAKLKGYQESIKPGLYEFQTKMTNVEAVNMLRSGDQKPLKLTFNNLWKVEEIGPILAEYTFADSVAYAELIADPAFIQEMGFTPETFICMFIPNTYELFVTATPKEMMERMKKEYERFWDGERAEKAAAIGLSPVEIMTVASIVQKESNSPKESKIIAGLYLNRWKKNWKLQADPTVVYANGVKGLSRVLNEHLEVESPYNTYRVEGLPPGPICMPDIGSIDAVLNYDEHDYMYMCAKGDGSGEHNFAKSLRQHNNNRLIYDANLRKRDKR